MSRAENFDQLRRPDDGATAVEIGNPATAEFEVREGGGALRRRGVGRGVGPVVVASGLQGLGGAIWIQTHVNARVRVLVDACASVPLCTSPPLRVGAQCAASLPVTSPLPLVPPGLPPSLPAGVPQQPAEQRAQDAGRQQGERAAHQAVRGQRRHPAGQRRGGEGGGDRWGGGVGRWGGGWWVGGWVGGWVMVGGWFGWVGGWHTYPIMTGVSRQVHFHGGSSRMTHKLRGLETAPLMLRKKPKMALIKAVTDTTHLLRSPRRCTHNPPSFLHLTSTSTSASPYTATPSHTSIRRSARATPSHVPTSPLPYPPLLHPALTRRLHGLATFFCTILATLPPPSRLPCYCTWLRLHLATP